jgi:tRNA 2-thiouridine synthesizing protein A
MPILSLMHQTQHVSDKERMTKTTKDFLNAVGLPCPVPILRIAVKAVEMRPNDILEVVADCPTFEEDVREWCNRLNKKIVSVSHENGQLKRICIRL